MLEMKITDGQQNLLYTVLLREMERVSRFEGFCLDFATTMREELQDIYNAVIRAKKIPLLPHTEPK